jgi:hypothetical protein
MASKKSEYPVANEAMSLEESFHNCFLYFMEAVDVLSLDAAEQCEAMGNFNVAWEIQHDVFDGGTSLINWPIDYLSPSEKDAIAHVITPLKGLPDGALISDNLRAMSHPSWADLRIAAKRLRVQLDDAVKKNRKFFDNQRLQR